MNEWTIPTEYMGWVPLLLLIELIYCSRPPVPTQDHPQALSKAIMLPFKASTETNFNDKNNNFLQSSILSCFNG